MAITRIGNIANTIPDNSIANSKFADIVNFKNIIINGDLSIAQRSTSVASITTNGIYTVDRMALQINSLGTWTQSQSTDVPTGQGFAKSLKMDCTTADASPASGDRLYVRTLFEGQNLQYLKKGTANAESLTASFWVKSNKTGTYIASLYDGDNNRRISKSYTVDVTDTWEKKTITYPGDTTGTLDNDNARSIELQLGLGAGTNFNSGTLATNWETNTDVNSFVGQVNLADSTANEWYITGVQLEAGTTASDFEFLPYDVNFLRCQRYYTQVPTLGGLNGHAMFLAHNINEAPGGIIFPTIMRTSPTVTTYDNAGNSGAIHKFGSPDISGVTVARPSPIGYGGIGSSGSFVAGGIYIGTWKADAEL